MSTYKGIDECTNIILDFIAGGVPGNLSGESGGNYNAVIGDARAKDDLGKKTIAEIYKLMDKRLAAGMPSTAIGRYQIIRATLQASVAALNLTGGTTFTRELQDRLGLHLMVGRSYSLWWLDKITDEEFAHGLSLEWASLPDPERGGKSHYDGVGANHSSTTLSIVYAMLQKAKKAKVTLQPPFPVVPPPSEEPPAADIRALVVMLQRALADQGFEPGPVDGDPGTRTLAALKRWRDRAL